MTKEQFREIKAILQENAEIFKEIAENTKPASKARRIFEAIGLIATICGLVGFVDQIIQWMRL